MRVRPAAGVASVIAACILAYPENPPVAHTGGFGEPSCHTCHFDGALNEPGGSLMVRGMEGGYRTGKVYELRVVLNRPGMQRAGFQLSVRTEDGRQAGELAANNERVGIDEAEGIQYIRHTPEGTSVLVGDSAVWRFDWQAPADSTPVVIHVSANAANGDESEFGDAIYQAEYQVSF